MAQNSTLTPVPKLEDARQQGSLVDIKSAKNQRQEATNVVKPFLRQVQVKVESNPQQNLDNPIFNTTNNNPILPPRAIIESIPDEDGLKPIVKGFAGSSDGNPLVGLERPVDADLDGRPDKLQKTQVQVTASDTLTQETTGNYQPTEGTSTTYQKIKTGEDPTKKDQVDPTKSAKVKAGVIHDQTAINQAVDQLNAIGLKSTNGEKLLRSLGITQDTVGEKIRTEGYNPNYYQELEQYAGDVIRSRIKKLDGDQTSTQVPKVTQKSAEEKANQTPSQGRNAPIPYNNIQPDPRNNRSKNQLEAPISGSGDGGLADVLSAPVPQNSTNGQQGNLDTSKAPAKANSPKDSQTQPQATIPQQGQIPSQTTQNPEPALENKKDNTVGNAKLGDIGVNGDGTGQLPLDNSINNQTNPKNLDRFDPETPDDQIESYYKDTDATTGQETRYPLPNSDEFTNPPDFQGKTPSNEVPYRDQPAERQEYLRNQALQANQDEQERIQNTPGFIEQKESQLQNLKKSEQGLEQAQRTGDNPANQKSKLQEGLEGKLRDAFIKAIAPYVAWATGFVVVLILVPTMIISIFQTFADAHYCKNGIARAVATVADGLASTISPIYRVFKEIIPKLAACDKANQNSSSPNCNGNSGATGTVVVSGCLTKAIDGKKDEDVLILWKANGISPVKNVPIAVGEFRKVIRIFSKAGLSQKDTDDSVAFVISLMATESSGRKDAWDLINGRKDAVATKGDDPDVREPLYCIGVGQMCPKAKRDGYKFGMEDWAATAGVPLKNELRYHGYGLIEYKALNPEEIAVVSRDGELGPNWASKWIVTTPEQTELNYINQAKVINAGRKAKIRESNLRNKSEIFKATAGWLGGGCDDYGTCTTAYGEAAERNYNELFASCATQQPPIANNPTPTTYAKLEEKLRDAVLNPETSVQSDWKWFNPLGGVDAFAQADINKILTPDEIKLLDEIALTKGYVKFADAGSASPNFIKALDAMMTASNGKLKIIGGQISGKGYRSPAESYQLFIDKIDPANRWRPSMSPADLDRIKPFYLERAASVAPPFFSEHTAGIAVDFELVEGAPLINSRTLRDSPAYDYLTKNAAKYGFEESYPEGSNKGAGPEPWHWRFKGNAEYPPAPNSSTPDGATSTTATGTNPCPKPGGLGGSLGSGGVFNPGGYIRPVAGCTYTSPYGPRWGKVHNGIDIACPVGTPIMAAKEGVVVEAGWNDGGYGFWVMIKHSDGAETLYGHNDSVLVKKGQVVKQGDIVSLMGSTGFSTGPHLHFEIRPNGELGIDPCGLIPCGLLGS